MRHQHHGFIGISCYNLHIQLPLILSLFISSTNPYFARNSPIHDENVPYIKYKSKILLTEDTEYDSRLFSIMFLPSFHFCIKQLTYIKGTFILIFTPFSQHQRNLVIKPHFNLIEDSVLDRSLYEAMTCHTLCTCVCLTPWDV